METKAAAKEQDLKDEVKLKILMSEVSKESPSAQLLILRRIIESYEEKGRELPPDVKKYIQKEAMEIYDKLKKEIMSKKAKEE